jgi:HEAT repeat protein/TolA-binding protein
LNWWSALIRGGEHLPSGPAQCIVGVTVPNVSLEGRTEHMVIKSTSKSPKIGWHGLLAVVVFAGVLLPLAKGQNRSSPESGSSTSNGDQKVSAIDGNGPASQARDPAEELLQRADAYRRQRRFADAGELYRHILDKYPDSKCATPARGSLLLSMGMLADEGGMQAAVESLLGRLPKDERLLKQVLQAADELRLNLKYAPARQLYQYAIGNWPTAKETASPQMCLVDLGLAALVEAGNQSAIQEAVAKVIAQFKGNPYLPRTIERVGGEYSRTKHYAEAEAMFRKAIELAADDLERAADAQMAIAWLYFERGLYDDAMREYGKVVRDYSKTASAAGGQYWLGQCYLRKGDLEQAEQAYQKTIELYPGDIYAGHAEKQLALIDRRREIQAAAAKRREALQNAADQRSSQAGQVQRLQEVRQVPNTVRPAQPAPALVLSTADYEARVAEILQRFSAAAERSYRDAGLTKQDVERASTRTSSDPDKVKAYRQSWLVISRAWQAATNEMAALGPGAVPVLLRAKNTPGERRGGDIFTSAIGRIGPSAVPAAIEGLSDSDAQVRARAAGALYDIRDRRAVEPLIRALTDSDRNVLIVVVHALGVLGDARAAEPLLALWSKQDSEIRAHLASALGSLHERRAVEPILAVLDDWLATARTTDVTNDPIRWWIRLAIEALGEIGDPRAVSWLEEIVVSAPLKWEDGLAAHDAAGAAAEALRRFGREITVDETTGRLKVIDRRTPSPSDTPGHAPRPPAGANLGPDAAQGDKQIPLPAQAVTTPGSVTGDSESRVAAILQRFSAAVEKAYQDVGLTKQSVESLLSVAPMGQGTNATKAYDQSWPAIVKAQQAAIDEMASLGPNVVPILLRSRDSSGDRRVGDLFVSAIARIGAPAVPAAIDGLSKGDQPVRLRAVNALRDLRDPRAVEPLLQALADSDKSVRIAVVQTLGTFADPRAADPLLALWSQQDDETRAQLAWALGRLRDRRAVTPLTAALRDWLATAEKTGVWGNATGWRMRFHVEA